MSQSHPGELCRGWNLAPAETEPPFPAGSISSTSRADFSFDPDPSGETVAATPSVVDGPIPFPDLGERIGGFRLVAELGRGAFGRVYLAEEAGLGNRPVALKVTRPEGDEPRLLARLQHTHIVPIHSVSDDPVTGLRLMCMPYFGGANLAEVLAAASHRSASESTGLSLVEALDLVGSPAPSEDAVPASRARRFPNDLDHESDRPHALVRPGRGASAAPLLSILGRISWWSRSIGGPARPVDDCEPIQPARRFLRESSFVRASTWIAARLAEGLEHAHSRGLLHRDLKPSNILIAADGTPMLLDFNLAADCVTLEEGARAMVGGTLPYMAPEHLDAFHPEGSTPAEAVDERSDIYALGLILFEMIAGEAPFPEPTPGRPLLEIVRAMTEERRGPAPSPREVNPEIPRSLDAIVRKAIDPDPARRHARAGDLAEDLRSYLDDLPLKHTREPSLAERLAKWSRRHPRLTSGSTVALLALVLIATIAGTSWTLARHLRQVSARLQVQMFEQRFLESQFLLNVAPGPRHDPAQGIKRADEAIALAALGESGPSSRSWLSALPLDEQIAIRGDLAELIVLAARARVRQAERTKSEPRRRVILEQAIAQLDRAEKLDPRPSPALFADRAAYHAALGEAREAALDRGRSDAIPPVTGRDFYLAGTSLLARGEPDRAEVALARATSLDPRRFWGWFALGLCHYDQQRYAESAGDFALCGVLAPRFSWPWMNRGLALARAGRLVEAREAYNRAIEVDPANGEALVNRALTLLELGEPELAVLDLRRAEALGLTDPAIRTALAEGLARSGHREEGLRRLEALIEADSEASLPRVARGMILIATDPRAAEAEFRRVLTAEPHHPVANLGLARLLRLSAPEEALVYADRAVLGEPEQLGAREVRAWLRGRLGIRDALEDVALLVQAPTATRLYNAACVLAILGEATDDSDLAPQALELLRRALELGFPRALLRDDPDLVSLGDWPAFQEWVE